MHSNYSNDLNRDMYNISQLRQKVNRLYGDLEKAPLEEAPLEEETHSDNRSIQEVEIVQSVVYIAGLTGQTITIDDASAKKDVLTLTLNELKDIIVEKTGITRQQQQLVFKGSQLKGNKKLSAYEVEYGSQMHLVLRFNSQKKWSEEKEEKEVKVKESEKGLTIDKSPQGPQGSETKKVDLKRDSQDSTHIDSNKNGSCGYILKGIKSGITVLSGSASGYAVAMLIVGGINAWNPLGWICMGVGALIGIIAAAKQFKSIITGIGIGSGIGSGASAILLGVGVINSWNPLGWISLGICALLGAIAGIRYYCKTSSSTSKYQSLIPNNYNNYNNNDNDNNFFNFNSNKAVTINNQNLPIKQYQELDEARYNANNDQGIGDLVNSVKQQINFMASKPGCTDIEKELEAALKNERFTAAYAGLPYAFDSQLDSGYSIYDPEVIQNIRNVLKEITRYIKSTLSQSNINKAPELLQKLGEKVNDVKSGLENLENQYNNFRNTYFKNKEFSDIVDKFKNRNFEDNNNEDSNVTNATIE